MQVRCPSCGRLYSSLIPLTCSCGEPLGITYDYDNVDVSAWRDRKPGVWRYRELLPDVRKVISLNEGGTPLLKAKLGEELGLNVFIKDETRNPTGSFRDRLITVALSYGLPYAENGFVTSPLPEKDYIDTFVADIALEHLDAVTEPFFSWVSFCTPHNPWDPPKPFDTMFDPADIPMPHRAEGELETKPPQWVDHVARTIASLPYRSMDPDLPGGADNAYARFPEDKTRRMLAAYYGQIAHLDKQVGRLLDALGLQQQLGRRGHQGPAGLELRLRVAPEPLGTRLSQRQHIPVRRF